MTIERHRPRLTIAPPEPDPGPQSIGRIASTLLNKLQAKLARQWDEVGDGPRVVLVDSPGWERRSKALEELWATPPDRPQKGSQS
jgi:hypothetical protein